MLECCNLVSVYKSANKVICVPLIPSPCQWTCNGFEFLELVDFFVHLVFDWNRTSQPLQKSGSCKWNQRKQANVFAQYILERQLQIVEYMGLFFHLWNGVWLNWRQSLIAARASPTCVHDKSCGLPNHITALIYTTLTLQPKISSKDTNFQASGVWRILNIVNQ